MSVPEGGRVVIVGASAAGLTAAETLRRTGFGGQITLMGDEPHAPYDRPPLSKRVLRGDTASADTALRTAEQIAALDLDLRLGVTAQRLATREQALHLAGGEALRYDGLIIATGVRPRNQFGAHPAVHVLRTMTDAVRLGGRLSPGCRVVIIGAGLIGAEVASVAQERGATVTLISRGAVPLAASLGVQVGGALTAVHRERGVDVRCGAEVSRLLADGDELHGVQLADGTVLPADEVLVATGATPNTEWLAGSGLDISDGILCDDYCAAGPNIYAAGDVARWRNPLFGVSMRIEHRTNAGEQAMAAVRNLLRPAEELMPFAPVPYFWSDQYDLKVQSYGYVRGADEERLVYGALDAGEYLVAFRRGDRFCGFVSAGLSPKALRRWRQTLTVPTSWAEVPALAAA